MSRVETAKLQALDACTQRHGITSGGERLAALDALIAAVREEEREACAGIVQAFADGWHDVNSLREAAARIRARGKGGG